MQSRTVQRIMTQTRKEATPGLSVAERDEMSPSTMSDAALHRRCINGAKRIARELESTYKKIRPDLPYIAEMRRRFSDRPRGRADIAGCKSWSQYVTRYLQRSERQIQRLLKELPDPFAPHVYVDPNVRIANMLTTALYQQKRPRARRHRN